ncbi:MAG: anthranilate synthase component I [Phycisphaerae bacterium]|nr:anthranilate synthase component I [Phycisphaerae bacterium]
MNIGRTTFSQFSTDAARFNRVPVVETLVGDELTPVSAYAALAKEADRAFLLESVVGGEKLARYSFLGVDPTRTLSATREQVLRIDHRTGAIEQLTSNDPLTLLQAELRGIRAAPRPGLPRFVGGAVGYAAYDLIRYYEKLPNAPRDDRNVPDLCFDLYDTLLIFDHVFKRVHIVAHATIAEDASRPLREAYDDACARIEGILARLQAPREFRAVRLPAEWLQPTHFVSNFQPGEFERAVRSSQEYIKAGDIFQVVLSQRLEARTTADPFAIYRAARLINPSPFMFLLKSPQMTLVGASPEIMCRVEDGVVTNRPLAGTRPRGGDEATDARLREELLADQKERAEHVMLVDLGRNDLGRVCKPASVKLRELMAVENYSHVMHISSTVVGELAEGLTAFDALRATLPVGTVSGAPKVRALEIIDELEPTRRGPYAGAVGYVDFAGNMDTCIALRTVVLLPRNDGLHTAYVQAGAGIVADSDPRREFEETQNKAKGMLAAIRVAEECF